MDGLQFVQSYIVKSAEKIDHLYIRKEKVFTLFEEELQRKKS
ncbi:MULTISPECIES: hypothetical protein [unclassified Bacillus cereus group]|nr:MULTISPECIES: hypothetical protein [unclassified Bacillus cereus group]